MSARLTWEGIHIASLRQINSLPEDVKRAIYCSLIPKKHLEKHCPAGARLSFQVRCPENSGFVEIDIRHTAEATDPMLYVQMADTANGQLEVILLIVNDPAAPRFDVDRDWKGEYTKLGTMTRNIPAEIEAMNAGLAPGQVRKGLRLSKELIPSMERFVASLNKDRFFIEPLAYHAAIMFERYGFAYMIGQTKMEQIHAGFKPDGVLYARLDGSTLFRQPGFDKTVRGRSWAIHDGILDEAWTNVKMYKRIAHHAGICTFPNARY
jgi:hypothetical protein